MVKRRRNKVIKTYKQAIWNKGGRLPEDVAIDPDPMAIANLDSKLRKLKGKKTNDTSSKRRKSKRTRT